MKVRMWVRNTLQPTRSFAANAANAWIGRNGVLAVDTLISAKEGAAAT